MLADAVQPLTGAASKPVVRLQTNFGAASPSSMPERRGRGPAKSG